MKLITKGIKMTDIIINNKTSFRSLKYHIHLSQLNTIQLDENYQNKKEDKQCLIAKRTKNLKAYKVKVKG